MRLTIALVGAHAAGKTTLGRALAAALGVPFYDEVGRRLAEACPPQRTAADAQEAFDEAVFREELARDAAWAADTRVSGRRAPGADYPTRTRRRAMRVVETWHPGNLAYAARRSPGVVERYRSALTTLGPALVLPIHVSPAIAAARQNEPGDPAFFRAVGAEAEAWARALGLHVLAPLDNDGPLDLSVRRALARLPFTPAQRPTEPA